MFYYLKGTVTQKGENFLVLDISGIGFKVFTSNTTLSNIVLNNECTVYTYTYVREDAFDIFGFSTADELTFFQKLISISGVGPRLALAILSTFPSGELVLAVLTSDVKKISKAPGVGPKLAQRIILELKDKMKAEEVEEAALNQNTLTSGASEAVSALLVLGYSEAEARHAVSAVGEGFSLEDTIKKALVALSR